MITASQCGTEPNPVAHGHTFAAALDAPLAVVAAAVFGVGFAPFAHIPVLVGRMQALRHEGAPARIASLDLSSHEN